MGSLTRVNLLTALYNGLRCRTRLLGDHGCAFSWGAARVAELITLIGVIKGSEEALQREDHCLDLAAYERVGKRRQTMFANQRSDSHIQSFPYSLIDRKRVYDVFAAYRKEKKSKGHIDTADRCVEHPVSRVT